MAKAKAVWGIDVGHCALKALKLALDSEDDVQILAFDYIEHGKILSQPEAEPAELIAASLEKFLSRNDISEDKVVIGVPGQHTLARFSKLPPVDTKKIPDIVQFEANQQIPFDMDEVVWDYQTFMEEDSPEIEVGIFAMKRDLIHGHLAHFADVGIEPIIVQSAPLALFDAMMYDGQCSSETTAIVDIGADNADLVITDGTRIWTRTIPIGGNSFTEALVNGFKLSFSKAENLKRQAATSKYARQIFQAMRPIFADLVGEIQRSIGFYTSTHREANLDRMVGMGSAFKLPGLQKFLQQNLGMTVLKPSEFKKIKPAAGVTTEYKENVLSLGVSYGLALQGLGKGQMTSNLLPPEIARQVTWRKKKPWFAAAAACLALSSLLVWYRQAADLNILEANKGSPAPSMNYAQAKTYYDSGINSNLPPRQYSETALAMLKAIKGEYDHLQSLGKVETEQCEEILSLERDKSLWFGILDAIHRALPQPQGALAQAATGEEVVQAILGDDAVTNRGDRRQIFIEGLNSRLVSDVYQLDYRDRDDIEVGRELFEYFDKEGVLGFEITLDCTTPNAGKKKFVEDFLAALAAQGQVPARGFYFDGIRVLTRQPRRLPASTTLPGTLTPGGRGRSLTPMGQEDEEERSILDTRNFDPLTLEDNSNDWSFSVKFVVALADLPPEKTPGSPTPKAQSNQKSGGSSGRRGRGGR